MIKMVAFVKRKQGLTREEFIQKWVHDQTKLSKILGMKGYRINIALEPQPGDNEPPYDGTAEIWWEDLESMQKHSIAQRMSSPQKIPKISAISWNLSTRKNSL